MTGILLNTLVALVSFAVGASVTWSVILAHRARELARLRALFDLPPRPWRQE